jgi:peptide chain release factor 2
MNKLSSLKNKLDKFKAIDTLYGDITVLIEFIKEDEDDESLFAELTESWDELQKKHYDFELELLLSEEFDSSNAYISIHPGAGGTESQDWASMLTRMYTMWAEKHSFKVETIDYLPGEVAGIKNITLLIKGDNAYGYLKCEKGVHRLVRISPFDSNGRRHTSFASVDVTPEFETETDEIEIDDKDIRIDTFRASGAGGQHVNKTDSAIRITHFPTGIVVQCQKERSQTQNKETSMKMLKAKLLLMRIEEQRKKVENIQGEQKKIEWGSQIRSYTLQPYQLIKDHRTGIENGNTNDVLDGNIDEFIKECLLKSCW